ncbi:MAG TPA: hypothetical protein RMH99_12785 [Sandaracinaceae bacterium LLY-WYZ-13_1]|nr:hypothetical protein [Sandaracinaceae bacterium LLY-WYZ-13_1]
MADEPLQKGERVFVRRLGHADTRGKITWVGPSKYGPGLRYGVRGDDGGMHWVDEEHVERETPNEPSAGDLAKGSRVQVVSGPHAGVEGDVFTIVPTGRIGVRDDDEETYWVEREHLELA